MGSTVSGEYSSPLLVVVIADADVRFRVGALFFLSQVRFVHVYADALPPSHRRAGFGVSLVEAEAWRSLTHSHSLTAMRDSTRCVEFLAVRMNPVSRLSHPISQIPRRRDIYLVAKYAAPSSSGIPVRSSALRTSLRDYTFGLA